MLLSLKHSICKINYVIFYTLNHINQVPICYCMVYIEEGQCFLHFSFLIINLLQKTLSSLELHGVASVANATSHISFGSVSSNQDINRGSSSNSEYSGKPRKRIQDPARDISIQVLEKFSLVTKFARETTTQLFRESQNNGFNNYGKIQKNEDAPSKSSVALDHKIEANIHNVPVPTDPLKVGCFLHCIYA